MKKIASFSVLFATIMLFSCTTSSNQDDLSMDVTDSLEFTDLELWASQNHKLELKADRGVMENPLELSKFIQIAIIVEDIEAAAREWSEILNVPMPEIKLHQTVDTTDPNLNYYGKNYKYGLKLASIMAPQGFIIELHQIIDDNPST